ncbi:MAG: hypothetical protein ABIF85_01420 [Nanoarchaeota archaeon]|nr:hypothetical protein [Nanoarchaeota archaeon]MBU4299761.1 hypothetical protein [Nanoarchaeota archaeon]MBU4452575.1 hypothetical protein [Nanoarchaeota archaeon]MCG2723540.1 hypothetical protein [archaeon]
MKFEETVIPVMKIVFLATILYSVMLFIASKFPSVSQPGTMLIISILALIITFTFSAFMHGKVNY